MGPTVPTSAVRPTNTRMCTMYTLLRISLYIGGLGILVLLAVRKIEHTRAEKWLSGSNGMETANKDHLLLRGVYQERISETQSKTDRGGSGPIIDERQKKQHLMKNSVTDIPSRSELRDMGENNVNALETERPTYKPTYKPTFQPTFQPAFQPTFLPTSSPTPVSHKDSNSAKHEEKSREEIEMPLSHITPHDNKHDEVALTDHHEGVHEMPLTHATPHDREEAAVAISTNTKKMQPLASSSSSNESMKNTVHRSKTPTLGIPQSSSVGINKYDLKVYTKNKATSVVTQSKQSSYTCKGGVNPFKNVPPDAFTPPREANDEVLKQWAAAVHEVTTKISRLQVGGQKLREAASIEAKKLDELRLTLFCPIIDNSANETER